MAVWRGQECPRLHPNGYFRLSGGTIPFIREILHQLSVMIPGVHAVLEGHAQPGGGVFGQGEICGVGIGMFSSSIERAARCM